MISDSAPVALLVPPSDFAGAPFLALVSRLQDAGVPFVAASNDTRICRSGDGVRVTASGEWTDRRLLALPALVVFDNPRGQCAQSIALRQLISTAFQRGALIAGVGLGVRALAVAGLLRGRQVAADPELDELLGEASAFRLAAPFAIDGAILTATSAGAGALADELMSIVGIRPLPIEQR
jgi:transcriptional regulator GlxA family with amidase domain